MMNLSRGPLAALLASLGCLAGACGGGGDSAPATVAINEIMPSNMTSACTDELGGHADWIELYNTGSAEVDLEGMSVSDDPEIPLKKKLGSGLKIPAGGVILLWADDKTTQGPGHLPFKLSSDAEQFLIYDKGGKLIDQYSWTAASPDLSYARLPDGTGSFQICAIPTCGKVNGSSCGT